MNSLKLKILQDTFDSRFNLNNLKRFTIELLKDCTSLGGDRHNCIWEEFSSYIKAYYPLYSYNDRSMQRMIVLAVELSKGKHARRIQRSFISRILNENNYDAAIVAFYCEDESSWRLSFVKQEYSFTEGGIKLDLTPVKRYSYLVGENEPNHTAQRQLLPIMENDFENPTIEIIEDAFSVEKITKDFFNQYKNKYILLKDHLKTNPQFVYESQRLGLNVEVFADQFSKKMMGQLTFLYFLQKKGWLGVDLIPTNIDVAEYDNIAHKMNLVQRDILEKVYVKYGETYLLKKDVLLILDSNEINILTNYFAETKFNKKWGEGNQTFIRDCFNEYSDKELNYFNDFLKPLFYLALNKRRKNNYFRNLNTKIPFLNGGLFEPLYDYNWRETNFEIPNIFFSNVLDKGKEADGLLDIFDRYNFTVNEDEPLEKEVAIDPEMLGKIFENLLDENDRKSSGSFYTRKEIVHYMCQESIINYLSQEVDIPSEDIREFIMYGDLLSDCDFRNQNDNFSFIKPSILMNIIELDDALKNVRVADPSVGSGAFPLGILNEIIRARSNITNYIVKIDKENELGVGEEAIRRTRSPYEMKWDTIKNCIFAVDIDASAVEITKLRLWLSLVVDQEIIDGTTPPHALPNLDCNIMVGDTLIDEYNGLQLFDSTLIAKMRKKKKKKEVSTTIQLRILGDSTEDLLNKMFELQSRYFDEDDEEKKKEYKGKIDDIRNDLIKYTLQQDNSMDWIEVDKFYKELKHNKSKPYFLWELEYARVFKEKGGFDIVIGNPPYIGEKNNADKFQAIKRCSQWNDFCTRRMNIYYCFVKKGLDLLKSEGILSYIIPHEWLTADNANKLREYILNYKLCRISHFADNLLFEGIGTSSMILEVGKSCNKKNEFPFVLYTGDGEHADNIFKQDKITTLVKQDSLDQSGNKIWSLNAIDQKQENNSKIVSLGSILDVSVGIQTGANKVTSTHVEEGLANPDQIGKGIYELRLGEDIKFLEDDIFLIMDGNALKLNEYETKYIKPLYSGSDLNEWSLEKPQTWMIYVHNKLDEEKCISIIKFLKQFKKILVNRSTVKGQTVVEPEEFDQFSLDDIKRVYSSAGSVQKVMRRKEWYSIFFARENIDFKGPKIMTSSRALKFCFSTEEAFASSGVNFIFFSNKNNKDYQLEIERYSSKHDYLMYVNAILNSDYMKKNLNSQNLNALTGNKIKNEILLYQIDFTSQADILIYNSIVNRAKKIYECKDSVIYNQIECEINELVIKLYSN